MIFVYWWYANSRSAKECPKDEWSKDKFEYCRIVGDFAVNVHILGETKREFLDDILYALSEPFPIVEKIIRYLSTITDYFGSEFSICIREDCNVETSIYTLEWFHGLELVESITSMYNIHFIRDYDGVAKIGAKVDCPMTHKKLELALNRIFDGLKLYYIIKSAQEGLATQLALNYVASLRNKENKK